MTICGKYKVDQNWVTMFCDNTIYSGEWRSVTVGNVATGGGILTQEVYDDMASKAERVGTIVLN